MRELFLGLSFGFADIITLFVFMMPLFLLMVLPISCMLSVFLTFLRMSTDRELIALKAGGVSIYQMLRGPFFFSLVCMGLGIFVSLYGIAWGMGNFRSTILQIASTRARVVVQPGVFNKDILAGVTLFARKVDPETGALRQVLFEDDTRNDGARITILAPEGDIGTDEARGQLVFTLHNGRIYRVQEEQFSILDFGSYTVRLDIGKAFSGVDLGLVKPKEMQWKDLLRMNAERNAPSKRYQFKVDVEIHKRLALPVACLALGLFAVPLACAFDGVKRQLGVVLALVMFMAYYSIFSFGLTSGESGRLPPTVGLWLANLLFGVTACAGIVFAGKERFPTLRFSTIMRTVQHRFSRLIPKREQ
jgi:lipopolysaccharide export system permease protein